MGKTGTSATPSTADAIDLAREEAAALGHELGAWHTNGPTLLAACCTRCGRTVWAGKRERFGLPLVKRCEVG